MKINNLIYVLLFALVCFITGCEDDDSLFSGDDANWEKLKEGSNMCEALKELFADDLRESREQGIIEGRIEGRNAGRIEGRIEGRCDITCNSYSCA